jgi:uncharacterized phage infection (PIP) family protein YhgE
MPMQAESLQVLENASVAPAQARAIVRAIEIEIAGAKDTLATKHDVLALHQASDVTRAELRAEMKALAAELRGEMAQLAAELRGEMAQLAAELRGEMAQLSAELRAEMKQLSAELRGEMAKLAADLRAEMAKELGELRREISGVTRQMYVALLGQTAVLLGFFYFFIAEMR